MIYLEFLLTILYLSFLISLLSMFILVRRKKVDLINYKFENWPPKRILDKFIWTILISIIGLYLGTIAYIVVFLDNYDYSLITKIFLYVAFPICIITFVGTLVWLIVKSEWEEWKMLYKVPFYASMVVGVIGLSLQLFVTSTNSFFGKRHENFLVKGVVEDYFEGSRQREITFRDKISNKTYTIIVNKAYKKGDLFEKEMKIGNWGNLYTLNEQ